MERGNTTHNPRMDEELKHEAQGFTQGQGVGHVEPFRETEPLPDDTDSPEVEGAFWRDPDGVADGGTAEQEGA